jgi:hypothetical protein
MNPEYCHHEALAQLDNGRPLSCLLIWRDLLLSDRYSVELHLNAAASTLHIDPIASIRSRAISLLRKLLSSVPGQNEVSVLGDLLQAWGEMCYSEAPQRALQHWERAWSCSSDIKLAQQLALIYKRLGFLQGATVLYGEPISIEELINIEPWPSLACAAQSCEPCQQSIAPDDPTMDVWQITGGFCYLQRYSNPWNHTHGIAVQNANGAFISSLCRRYPWPWASCTNSIAFEEEAIRQMNWQLSCKKLLPLKKFDGVVLAIAELSGESFFHWQLELLPRLGRCWRELIKLWPNIKLWHNGGDSKWVSESLNLLGIKPDQCINSYKYPYINADLLLVPTFTSVFGSISKTNLKWLDAFWAVKASPSPGLLFFSRPNSCRRAVFGMPADVPSPSSSSIQNQLLDVARRNNFIAPHGAAMANLLAAPMGSALLELVNPAYKPPYFQSLINYRRLHHKIVIAAPTPFPLQELLYEGPLAFPIDLRPGLSPAAESVSTWLKAYG